MAYEQLKLENQLCFPVYAASRLITREYQPYLDKLGITYPQYLVLMVLWEHGPLSVKEISSKLILNTNTLTPLLKRMMNLGIVTRQRSEEDERKVIVALTEKGESMQHEAAEIPEKLLTGLLSEGMEVNNIIDLRNRLNAIIKYLSDKGNAL
ncbi:MarR family winged helix-turn-helix transcriptional regulator [Marinilabilia salmonicolor]|jgi:DNA-binding MarR family transcriptional regulator|uniref:HTH-type transcriptional regulator SarZ n=1 Tax=Marinilabilia salmonicolor TaxID=989 RepID=A0A2T0XQV9_9BACT|nr:MarR family transcriptional regulator [Marinilabilia salmonicolor]PRZ01303.1 MarR family transcriptional regulator [Marinilabilia salmonicolor]RCW39298.1 MarR family transcriptional regulator [Marinilabilia salmonicolor]